MRRFLERGRFKKSVQTHSLEGDNQNALFDFVHPDDRKLKMRVRPHANIFKPIRALKS